MSKEVVKADKATMTVEEVAARLGLHIQTVYKAIDRGDIKAMRFGRTIRISRSHVEHLVEHGTPRRAG